MSTSLKNIFQNAALTLASAVLFVGFFKLNGWIFADLAYAEGVNWVFLPAGFRAILILALGLSGATGIVLATWFLDWGALGSQGWLLLLNGVISGFTPYAVMKYLAKGQPPHQMLQEMTHELLWSFMHREALNLWVDVWPMFIGDTVGALLILFGFKLLLTQFKFKAL